MIEEDQIVQDIAVFERDQTITQIRERRNTHPTEQKVSAFKSRVFSLLMLFVEKSKNTQAILPLLTQQNFIKDPNHLRQLIATLINRDAVPSDVILTIASFYQNLLLFKHHKDSHKFTEDFVKLLRKIKANNQQQANEIIQSMFQTFITKRKCKLNVSFFSIIIKKIPSMRQAVIGKGVELEQREGVRPAQQRVLQKMLKHLVKNKQVKQEEVESQEQEM